MASSAVTPARTRVSPSTGRGARAPADNETAAVAGSVPVASPRGLRPGKSDGLPQAGAADATSPGARRRPAAREPNGPYTISELAREFDLTTRAIRFYEDCGLLTPARSGPNGRQRVYTARDRTRLKLTLRGKRLGVSLADIKSLVDMYESPRDTVPQLRRFLQVLGDHREQLEQQLEDLQVTLEEVRAHEREARRLLAGAGKD